MRPVNHLHAAGRLYPDAWQQVDIFRADRGRDLPDWPHWCFMPMAAWHAIASEGAPRLPIERALDVGRLAAIGTWRYSQGVYRFAPHVYSALLDTIPTGDMPVDVLYRLPEWSVYIETPAANWQQDPLHGFWAHLEWDANTGRSELRLLLDTDAMLIPIPLHMGPWTITEAMDRSITEAKRQATIHQIHGAYGSADDIAPHLYGLVSLVLYLCSDEPEIDDEREPGASPQRPKPTRTKGGWRLFAAKRPRTWSVGNELEKKLTSQAASEDDGTDTRKVAAHLRRAHWHGYWTGPRDGERRFGYKWLPPTVVAGDKNQ